MLNKFFIDSSMWIAYAVKEDPLHQVAVNTLKKSIKSAILYTSNDVFDETITRLVYTVGVGKAKRYYTTFQDNLEKGTLTQLWVDEKIQIEAWQILTKFSEHKLSLTDATSIALVRRFNLDAVVTFDSDFKKLGVSSLP